MNTPVAPAKQEAPASVAQTENEASAPVVPEAPSPVRGLKGQADKQHIILTWTVSTQSAADHPVAGYVIYRCQEGSMGRSCKECPAHFQCIAVVPATSIDATGKGTYTDTPPQEGGYSYKIKAVDVEGTAGTDSETILVRFGKKRLDG